MAIANVGKVALEKESKSVNCGLPAHLQNNPKIAENILLGHTCDNCDFNNKRDYTCHRLWGVCDLWTPVGSKTIESMVNTILLSEEKQHPRERE